MSGAILEIKNLNVKFKSSGVLKDFSYSLNAGETLSVVGESGCGKTVHALSILRLLGHGAEITGEILFKGRDVLKFDRAALRRLRGGGIAMIFQDAGTSLNPVLTVAEQIEETLLAHKITDKKNARAKAVELLTQVGIENAENKITCYPHEFSGGQKQRVMIAVALACKPEILIADEPTTALDVTVQKQIISLLKNLQKLHNMALIFITHNLALASALGGGTLVLYAGQTAEEAPAEELFSNPKHPYTRGLLKSAEFKPGQKRLSAIEGAPPPAGAVFAGCPFEPRCKKRMPVCARQNPPVFKDGKSKTRCFLSSDEKYN